MKKIMQVIENTGISQNRYYSCSAYFEMDSTVETGSMASDDTPPSILTVPDSPGNSTLNKLCNLSKYKNIYLYIVMKCSNNKF